MPMYMDGTRLCLVYNGSFFLLENKKVTELSESWILYNPLQLFLLCREKKSQEGFASVSMDTSASSLWRCSSKPNSSFVISISTVFVITCILTLIQKIDNLASLKQRNRTPRSLRTVKKH